METTNHAVSYKRRGTEGVLKLDGTIDIFEAANLHAVACKAFQDTKATSVCVDLAGAERLDLAALQILCALQRDVTTEGRAFAFQKPSERVAEQFTLIGHPGSAAECS